MKHQRLARRLLTYAAVLVVSGIGGSALTQQVPSPTTTPAAGTGSCTSLVRAAMESTDRQCGDTSRNQACYGHILNTASFRFDRGFVFEAQGDKAALDQIQTLDLSPLDLELEQWGVVLMQAQANLPDQLPGQNVTFILFGDVEIDNAVGDAVEVPARLIEPASIRIAPGANRAVIANLTPATSLFASGKYFNADGELWVRVGQSLDTEAFGWVAATLIETDIDRLPNISPTGETFNPMQAFYFKTGIGQPQCIEAPRDGMVVQTPRGLGRIDFTINGIDVNLGSTAYITSPEDISNTCVSLLEGEAILESDDITKTLRPGQRSCVALDENGIADGPPSEPDSFDPAEIALIAVVLDLLPDDVVIPEPAPSNTPTPTNTPRPTIPTSTPTFTATPTETPVPPVNTAIPTKRPTRTPTHTPSITLTPSETFTPSITPTPTPLPPVASFTFAISAMNVVFSDLSTNAPFSWAWDFGDSSTSGTQNPSHSYPYPGAAGQMSYVISLTVCNGGGCDTSSQTLTLPNCNFDPSQPRIANFSPRIGITYDEAVEFYAIQSKDEFCNPGPVVGNVSWLSSALNINGFEGQHFFSTETNSASFCASYILNGPGPFFFDVGVTCP